MCLTCGMQQRLSAIVGDMTIGGFLRGLRIYLRGWRPPQHVVLALIFGVALAPYDRVSEGIMLGLLTSGFLDVAIRRGWIRAESGS